MRDFEDTNLRGHRLQNGAGPIVADQALHGEGGNSEEIRTSYSAEMLEDDVVQVDSEGK